MSSLLLRGGAMVVWRGESVCVRATDQVAAGLSSSVCHPAHAKGMRRARRRRRYWRERCLQIPNDGPVQRRGAVSDGTRHPV
eukprot:scaffold4333_cov70-Isochrysis_galbana.AAC.1